MNEPTDEALFLAYCHGEHGAFRQLFTRYESALTRMMARGLMRQSETPDLVQQVFLQVHRARFDFDGTRKFRPWLYTIALNLKRQHLRRLGRRRESLEDTIEGVTAPHDPNVYERRRHLHLALRTLSPKNREVIELHWFDGLTFPEVSDVVGASLSAVKVRAHRGYEQLRKAVLKIERNHSRMPDIRYTAEESDAE